VLYLRQLSINLYQLIRGALLIAFHADAEAHDALSLELKDLVKPAKPTQASVLAAPASTLKKVSIPADAEAHDALSLELKDLVKPAKPTQASVLAAPASTLEKVSKFLVTDTPKAPLIPISAAAARKAALTSGSLKLEQPGEALLLKLDKLPEVTAHPIIHIGSDHYGFLNPAVAAMAAAASSADHQGKRVPHKVTVAAAAATAPSSVSARAAKLAATARAAAHKAAAAAVRAAAAQRLAAAAAATRKHGAAAKVAAGAAVNVKGGPGSAQHDFAKGYAQGMAMVQSTARASHNSVPGKEDM
jgi:hypothetical protein